jgi:TonB family protein
MTGGEDKETTPPAAATPVRSSLLVTVLAWAVALALIVGLALAVTQRLAEAGAALRDAIAQGRTSTSVAYESGAIDPPEEPASPPDEALITVDAEGRSVAAPRWVAVPSPDYPLTDDGDMVPGTVSLRCRVTAAGRLAACEIIDETPAGRGFGEAAVLSTRMARLTPRTVDGVPMEGDVRFTIRFTPQGSRP